MEVNLSGYNVGVPLFYRDKMKEQFFSPEIVTASYARVSRSKKNIIDLREEASLDIIKTRDFNKKIIYDMGHSSVSEHAVFNFDISDISRLALEYLEHFRLASYTEKSQRYVTFENNFYVPEEIKDNKVLDEFKRIVNLQFNYYNELINKNKHFLLNNKDFTEISKEDARYVLPLSTFSQVGMTVNAREINYIINKLSYSDLLELKSLGDKIFKILEKETPSLVQNEKYPKIGHASYLKFNEELKDNNIEDSHSNEVKLINCDVDFDNFLVSSIYFKYVNKNYDFNQIFRNVKKLSYNEKLQFIKDICRDVTDFDKILREFELVDFVFEAIVSASLFAQLKRHRMMTIIKTFYDIELGNVVPLSIKLINEEENFLNLIKETNDVYNKIKYQYSREIAEYILTNSHKCKVLFKIDARNLYKFLKLRLDSHAQWDIRELSKKILYFVEKHAPITMSLIQKKNSF